MIDDLLPEPQSDKTPPNVAAARQMRAQIAAGATATANDRAWSGADEEFVPAPQMSSASTWWHAMPNETQLMVFLAKWLKERRGLLSVQLTFPIPNMGEAKIPVVAFSVSATDTQLVLLVEPSLSGLQLPNGYEVQVITPDKTYPKAIYLGSFQPLPSFPFAVVSFLLDENS